jgi:hypothetical protein
MLQTRHAVVTETHLSFVQIFSQVTVTHHRRQHEEFLVKLTSGYAAAGLSIIGNARSTYITSIPLVTVKRLTVLALRLHQGQHVVPVPYRHPELCTAVRVMASHSWHNFACTKFLTSEHPGGRVKCFHRRV